MHRRPQRDAHRAGLGRRLRPESNAITDNKTWSVEAACNGILTGLVSVTAGCAAVTSWAAVIIGILSGAVYFATAELVLRIFKVDDVLNAFAVHAAGGLWGLLAAALFATPGNDADSYGAFYGMVDRSAPPPSVPSRSSAGRPSGASSPSARCG